jgi:membrane protein implicated in regulation of membrane protease activity
MTLLALYVGCLVLGGILVGASVLGGHGDADVDHPGDTDVDHAGTDHGPEEVHDAAGVLSTFASLRFWTFFVASFGLTGTLLTLGGAPTALALLVALATGTVAGLAVATLLRRMARDTVTTDTSTRRLAGKEAEIVLSVGPSKRGKIRVSHNGHWIELPASTREDHLLQRGERVLIVEIHAGEADVTPVAPARASHPPSLPT